jgi:NAD(P) transhydrogenase subunit alpha
MVPVVGVPRESRPGERRVAAVPDTVARLAQPGWQVLVERGAGAAAGYPDADYEARGATLVEPGGAAEADVVVRVAPPDPDEASALREGAIVVGLLEPGGSDATMRVLAERRCSAFALELVPRISRAQACDALSSQALVAGYRSVIEAAIRLPRFFPLAMTAAGTVPPSKVFVLGAGVAGLQAIATARRLGAVVEANDVRAAAAEEVASLGAKFIDLTGESLEGQGGYARAATEEEISRQRERLADHLAGADVVITTAAVPGRKAPLLVTRAMVERMKPGSVLVDLAAESGGNCELSVPGQDVVHGGVVVAGMANVASRMARDASALYARNISAFVALLVVEGELAPDLGDEILAGACLLRDGVPHHELVAAALGPKG